MKPYSDRDIRKALEQYPLTEEGCDTPVFFSEGFEEKMDALLSRRRMRGKAATVLRAALVCAVIAAAVPALAWFGSRSSPDGEGSPAANVGSGGTQDGTEPAQSMDIQTPQTEETADAAKQDDIPAASPYPWPDEAVEEPLIGENGVEAGTVHSLRYDTWQDWKEVGYEAPYTLMVPSVLPGIDPLEALNVSWIEEEEESHTTFMVSAYYGEGSSRESVVDDTNLQAYKGHLYFAQQSVDRQVEFKQLEGGIYEPVMVGDNEGMLWSFSDGAYWSLSWQAGDVLYDLHSLYATREELLCIAKSLVPLSSVDVSGSKTVVFSFSLPQDRGSVEMEIQVDGTTLLEQTVDTFVEEYSLKMLELFGSESGRIDVFFDGELSQSSGRDPEDYPKLPGEYATKQAAQEVVPYTLKEPVLPGHAWLRQVLVNWQEEGTVCDVFMNYDSTLEEYDIAQPPGYLHFSQQAPWTDDIPPENLYPETITIEPMMVGEWEGLHTFNSSGEGWTHSVYWLADEVLYAVKSSVLSVEELVEIALSVT